MEDLKKESIWSKAGKAIKDRKDKAAQNHNEDKTFKIKYDTKNQDVVNDFNLRSHKSFFKNFKEVAELSKANIRNKKITLPKRNKEDYTNQVLNNLKVLLDRTNNTYYELDAYEQSYLKLRRSVPDIELNIKLSSFISLKNELESSSHQLKTMVQFLQNDLANNDNKNRQEWYDENWQYTDWYFANLIKNQTALLNSAKASFQTNKTALMGNNIWNTNGLFLNLHEGISLLKKLEYNPVKNARGSYEDMVAETLKQDDEQPDDLNAIYDDINLSLFNKGKQYKDAIASKEIVANTLLQLMNINASLANGGLYGTLLESTRHSHNLNYQTVQNLINMNVPPFCYFKVHSAYKGELPKQAHEKLLKDGVLEGVDLEKYQNVDPHDYTLELRTPDELRANGIKLSREDMTAFANLANLNVVPYLNDLLKHDTDKTMFSMDANKKVAKEAVIRAINLNYDKLLKQNKTDENKGFDFDTSDDVIIRELQDQSNQQFDEKDEAFKKVISGKYYGHDIDTFNAILSDSNHFSRNDKELNDEHYPMSPIIYQYKKQTAIWDNYFAELDKLINKALPQPLIDVMMQKGLPKLNTKEILIRYAKKQNASKYGYIGVQELQQLTSSNTKNVPLSQTDYDCFIDPSQKPNNYEGDARYLQTLEGITKTYHKSFNNEPISTQNILDTIKNLVSDYLVQNSKMLDATKSNDLILNHDNHVSSLEDINNKVPDSLYYSLNNVLGNKYDDDIITNIKETEPGYIASFFKDPNRSDIDKQILLTNTLKKSVQEVIAKQTAEHKKDASKGVDFSVDETLIKAIQKNNQTKQATQQPKKEKSAKKQADWQKKLAKNPEYRENRNDIAKYKQKIDRLNKKKERRSFVAGVLAIFEKWNITWTGGLFGKWKKHVEKWPNLSYREEVEKYTNLIHKRQQNIDDLSRNYSLEEQGLFSDSFNAKKELKTSIKDSIAFMNNEYGELTKYENKNKEDLIDTNLGRNRVYINGEDTFNNEVDVKDFNNGFIDDNYEASDKPIAKITDFLGKNTGTLEYYLDDNITQKEIDEWKQQKPNTWKDELIMHTKVMYKAPIIPIQYTKAQKNPEEFLRRFDGRFVDFDDLYSLTNAYNLLVGKHFENYNTMDIPRLDLYAETNGLTDLLRGVSDKNEVVKDKLLQSFLTGHLMYSDHSDKFKNAQSGLLNRDGLNNARIFGADDSYLETDPAKKIEDTDDYLKHVSDVNQPEKNTFSTFQRGVLSAYKEYNDSFKTIYFKDIKIPDFVKTSSPINNNKFVLMNPNAFITHKGTNQYLYKSEVFNDDPENSPKRDTVFNYLFFASSVLGQSESDFKDNYESSLEQKPKKVSSLFELMPNLAFDLNDKGYSVGNQNVKEDFILMDNTTKTLMVDDYGFNLTLDGRRRFDSKGNEYFDINGKALKDDYQYDESGYLLVNGKRAFNPQEKLFAISGTQKDKNENIIKQGTQPAKIKLTKIQMMNTEEPVKNQENLNDDVTSKIREIYVPIFETPLFKAETVKNLYDKYYNENVHNWTQKQTLRTMPDFSDNEVLRSILYNDDQGWLESLFDTLRFNLDNDNRLNAGDIHYDPDSIHLPFDINDLPGFRTYTSFENYAKQPNHEQWIKKMKDGNEDKSWNEIEKEFYHEHENDPYAKVYAALYRQRNKILNPSQVNLKDLNEAVQREQLERQQEENKQAQQNRAKQQPKTKAQTSRPADIDTGFETINDTTKKPVEIQINPQQETPTKQAQTIQSIPADIWLSFIEDNNAIDSKLQASNEESLKQNKTSAQKQTEPIEIMLEQENQQAQTDVYNDTLKDAVNNPTKYTPIGTFNKEISKNIHNIPQYQNIFRDTIFMDSINKINTFRLQVLLLRHRLRLPLSKDEYAMVTSMATQSPDLFATKDIYKVLKAPINKEGVMKWFEDGSFKKPLNDDYSDFNIDNLLSESDVDFDPKDAMLLRDAFLNSMINDKKYKNVYVQPTLTPTSIIKEANKPNTTKDILNTNTLRDPTKYLADTSKSFKTNHIDYDLSKDDDKIRYYLANKIYEQKGVYKPWKEENIPYEYANKDLETVKQEINAKYPDGEFKATKTPYMFDEQIDDKKAKKIYDNAILNYNATKESDVSYSALLVPSMNGTFIPIENASKSIPESAYLFRALVLGSNPIIDALPNSIKESLLLNCQKTLMNEAIELNTILKDKDFIKTIKNKNANNQEDILTLKERRYISGKELSARYGGLNKKKQKDQTNQTNKKGVVYEYSKEGLDLLQQREDNIHKEVPKENLPTEFDFDPKLIKSYLKHLQDTNSPLAHLLKGINNVSFDKEDQITDVQLEEIAKEIAIDTGGVISYVLAPMNKNMDVLKDLPMDKRITSALFLREVDNTIDAMAKEILGYVYSAFGTDKLRKKQTDKNLHTFDKYLKNPNLLSELFTKRAGAIADKTINKFNSLHLKDITSDYKEALNGVALAASFNGLKSMYGFKDITPFEVDEKLLDKLQLDDKVKEEVKKRILDESDNFDFSRSRHFIPIYEQNKDSILNEVVSNENIRNRSMFKTQPKPKEDNTANTKTQTKQKISKR